MGAKINIIFLPVGSICAVLTQLCFLIPYVRQWGFHLRLNVRFSDPDMMNMYRLILPVMIGVSVNEINVLVDKTLASNVSVGGISALNYAYSLIMFVQGIFAQTIASVYYPSITRKAQEEGSLGLQKIIGDAVFGILTLLIPIAVLSLLLASPIISVLYGRGAFDDNALHLTVSAFVGYAIGIPFYGIREILSRVFYALHDTRTPTKNAIWGMICNIIMNLTFSPLLGVGGLALATSLSSVITSILLLWSLRTKGIFFLKSAFSKKTISQIPILKKYASHGKRED